MPNILVISMAYVLQVAPTAPADELRCQQCYDGSPPLRQGIMHVPDGVYYTYEDFRDAA